MCSAQHRRGLIRTDLRRDPLSGEVFIFINRRRTYIKSCILYCDLLGLRHRTGVFLVLRLSCGSGRASVHGTVPLSDGKSACF